MARDDYNPKLADETRTCCGCGKTWRVLCSPIKSEPPYSCGKPECNQARRTELGEANVVTGGKNG